MYLAPECMYDVLDFVCKNQHYKEDRLDGLRRLEYVSYDEMCDALSSKYSNYEIYYVVFMLQEKKYIQVRWCAYPKNIEYITDISFEGQMLFNTLSQQLKGR